MVGTFKQLNAFENDKLKILTNWNFEKQIHDKFGKHTKLPDKNGYYIGIYYIGIKNSLIF